jgi:phosphomevalonate kinase
MHFGVIPNCYGSEVYRPLAHNLAQYVHCLAQGKVGSGFDVSAAVFGSQVYRRFDARVLHDLMNVPGAELLRTISPDNSLWTHHVVPFKLPPLTRLMLADVNGGSDTPSFVKKVLSWRKSDEENGMFVLSHSFHFFDGAHTTP